MSRFNTRPHRPAGSSPVTTTGRTTTHAGGTGYSRDERSELVLLAAMNMVGQRTHYERADARDERYRNLIRHLAIEDPGWTAGMLGWLRTGAHMRTDSQIGAVEFVHARLAAARLHRVLPGPDAVPGTGETWNRSVVRRVLHRADEPGELLAYWTSRYGRALPQPVKRGVGDAVRRLYTERSMIKWDSPRRPYRFGLVLELTHARATPGESWQSDVFAAAVARRHGRRPDTRGLTTLRRYEELMNLPVSERRRVVLDQPQRIRDSGFTWETLAGWLQGPMDAAAWEAIIPSMGYMALIRNLRNFDEAGISNAAAAAVATRIADPRQVAVSRQFPVRFHAAHRAAAPSLRWGWALEQALEHSTANIPLLPGRTLILVDTSSSMEDSFSADGTTTRRDVAALFGIALAQRCEAVDLYSYSSGRFGWSGPPRARTRAFSLRPGEATLRAVERWETGGWFLGGGTDTAAAMRHEYRGHDRVVLITDEQHHQDPIEVSKSIPAHTPLYTWNLAGYSPSHAPSGPHRHTFGGLTDQAFRLIPLLEAGHTVPWPWEEQQ
ncbi:TROVE domain-containing protein [Streptomyces calidiresistens]|uniref:TROVE domain-containing protein n=1 Tax=Streptomyces calidiresistens TaxID=1485586 RepID=A0A7W3T2R9_9ACTN|nr:TROVE domain-containing protein [Streptomyces calidiresistens]MBB0229885.1 TROVE domain-containing protein [Streptomyces calidiresistens]